MDIHIVNLFRLNERRLRSFILIPRAVSSSPLYSKNAVNGQAKPNYPHYRPGMYPRPWRSYVEEIED